MPRNRREKHRSLACRVAAAHHDYVFAFTELRLHRRRSVVHAGPFELREVRNLQSAVLSAAGDNDSSSANDTIAVTFDGERPVIASYGRRPTSNGNLRSEFLGLHERAAGKVLPRNSQWKSQVVFDSRTGARLAPGAIGSSTSTLSPSEAPYTAAARPEGPAPTTIRS